MQFTLCSNIWLNLLKGMKVILACMGESFFISFHHLANTVEWSYKKARSSRKREIKASCFNQQALLVRGLNDPVTRSSGKYWLQFTLFPDS